MRPKIIVSGLYRSGTSMLMKILEQGGLTAIKDDYKCAGKANPNGFYEYREMQHFPEWCLEKEGDCIKVLVPQIKRIKGNHKIIFMHRDLQEIIDSISKMQDASMWAYSHLLGDSLQWLKDKDVIHLDYNRIMENPRMGLERIKDLIPNFDEAVKVVDPKLYRTKRKSGAMITEDDLEREKQSHEKRIKEIDRVLESFKEVANA